MIMNIVLVDDSSIHQQLLPLTYTRPISYLRVGIFTLIEKWKNYLNTANISCLSEDYLQEKYVPIIAENNIFINSTIFPDQEIIKAIQLLNDDEQLYSGDLFIAYKGKNIEQRNIAEKINFTSVVSSVNYYWDLFQNNAAEIVKDINFIKSQRDSQPLNDPFTHVYGQENLFIEEGAKIRAAIIDAESGPVYIGKNATVNEGAIIKGPFALCEGSSVTMGAKIRNATTIGPYSNVGGEVKNSIVLGYSNKGHDGYMGNSILGEWCNLGADTNTSNLKNTFDNVKVWSYVSEQMEQTDQLNCGLIMGDHSKAGINTMFNTATVVGVCVNLFGGSFPEKHIPSFSWKNETNTFQLNRAIEMANRMMALKNIKMSKEDQDIFNYINWHSDRFRF